MANESQVPMAYNFNLPHGDDEDIEDSNGEECEADKDTIFNFEEGFSDDEAQPPFTRPTFQLAKNKKSPRCSDEDAEEESGVKKKPRVQQSLFGSGRKGPFSLSDDEDEADDEGQPKAPTSMRGRMSSLTLDQQSSPQDNDEGSSKLRKSLLDALNESDRELSPPISDHSDDDGFPDQAEDAVASYGLRQGINRRNTMTALVDVDHSGDFDPAEEARKAKKLNKSKAKGKGKQKAVSQERVKKAIAKLHFNTLMGSVRNLTNDVENQPENYVIDSEDEREYEERQARYRNRKRIPIQIPIPDPLGEFPDLTGHPEARGCESCRLVLHDCSMIKDGEHPCAVCVDEGQECRPLIALKEKVRCGNCDQRGVEVCSYENTKAGEELGVFCDECLADDLEESCAIMPVEHKIDRIDLDRILYGPNRNSIDCDSCRTNNKKCSLKRKTDNPPCKGCKKAKVPCTFYSTQPREMSKKEGKKRASEPSIADPTLDKSINPDVSLPDSSFFTQEDMDDLEKHSSDRNNKPARAPTPEIELTDLAGRKGIVRKLQTSFAHPIVFHTTDGYAPDCDFCEVPAFGFVGHFEKTTHVLAWPSGAGYTEIAGGHRETNPESTKMCQNCTFARLQTVACEAHEVRAIDNETVNYAFESAADELMMAEARSEDFQRQLQRWCSICFSLAKHRCCAMQPSILSDPEDAAMIEGCGLRLCDRCARELGEVFGNDSHTMATAFDKEPKASGRGDEEADGMVRADVGFLKTDGLLMKSVDFGGA